MKPKDDAKIRLIRQVGGINQLLSLAYNQETRVSAMLTRLGFAGHQVEAIRRDHLHPIIAASVEFLKGRLTNGSDGERLFTVLNRRFGLDGEPVETLESIGGRLGVSRERVRQLEKKALRRCKHRASMDAWEARLREVGERCLKERGLL